MKRIVALIPLFLSTALSFGASDDWQEVLRDDDIVVFRKKIEGSPVLAFRGEATVNAPIAKVMTAIKDPNQRGKWTERVKSFQIIEEHSPCDRTEYMHVSSPFPARDRDFVIRSKLAFDEQSKKIVVQLRSVEDERRKKTIGKIRGVMHSSSFSLQPVNTGTTKIEAELHADPKGAVPKWLVNHFQKLVPKKSLSNLKKYLSENQVADDPMTVAFFSKTPHQRFPASDKNLHCVAK